MSTSYILEEMAGDVKLVLRLPPELHAALVQLAKMETRSLNGQIVHLLRRSVPEASPEEGQSTYERRTGDI